MFATINIKDFNKNCIILSSKTKNNVLQKGDFYRIYYADQNVCFSGVYIYFNFKNVKIDPYFNKIKCTFSKFLNEKTVSQLKIIEKKILQSLNIKKKPIYRIEEQLQQNFIKIFDDINIHNPLNFQNVDIYLKISGIWSNETEYGITFRFFFIH